MIEFVKYRGQARQLDRFQLLQQLRDYYDLFKETPHEILGN